MLFKTTPASRYISLIPGNILSRVKSECNWFDKYVELPDSEESIMKYKEGFLSVYTYPFTLGPIDPAVIDICKQYEITLVQIHPLF